jgi:hypothetical protein
VIQIPVTLACVAGTRHEEAQRAVDATLKLCDFEDVVLIKEHFSYEQYNRFIVYELKDYIRTDHVLLIQDDGFVTNPELWTDEFLEYDYIGAVWPLPQDEFSYRTPEGELIRVGNGGFSLRSKKLLEVATKENLEWKPYYGYWNEDGFICCHNRSVYERTCKFAPVNVAMRFSVEWLGDVAFGFHGKHRL